MSRVPSLIAPVAVLALAAAAHAVPIVDGTRAGDPYGSPLAVQTVQTGFGDNESEMNAAYAYIAGGRLHLMLTGNIQNNFNKLEIFIDSVAGGENTLTAAGIPDSEPSVNNLAGLTFDAGFAPDYYMFVRRGDSKFDLDYLKLGPAGTFTQHINVFGGQDFGAGTTGLGANTQAIGVAYNGSNTAGVLGNAGQAADQAAAAAVETGLELSVALADLGNDGTPGSTLRIAVMQGNGDHNYFSNQLLGGLPIGTGNLGGDGMGGFTGTSAGVNLQNFAGDQFFTVVVPEPTTLSMLGLAGLGLLSRRRAPRA